mmetsp:Transcript_47635/g.116030  ORF Transcript_47635/g.116030 Transcript_47635/m.116030 type:complete len:89 (-) Transcript_47635:629-895(-)
MGRIYCSHTTDEKKIFSSIGCQYDDGGFNLSVENPVIVFVQPISSNDGDFFWWTATIDEDNGGGVSGSVRGIKKPHLGVNDCSTSAIL